MKNFFVQNKKMWIGIGCGILAVVFIVGIILMAGGNSNNDPNPTNPSTSTTEPSDNVTEPSGNVTEPNGTEPGIGEPVEPDHPDDFDPDADPTPILPPVDPDTVLKPDVGDDELAMGDGDDDKDDEKDNNGTSGDNSFEGGSYNPGDDPVEPEPTEPKPTNPKPTEPKPTEPKPTQPAFNPAELDPADLTYEEYLTWDEATWEAYTDYWWGSSKDNMYKMHQFEDYNGYDSSSTGYYLKTEKALNNHLAKVEAGCIHCGSSDCEVFTWRNNHGYTELDWNNCPHYDETVCDNCGLKEAFYAESGELCCKKYVVDCNCHWCDEPVKADECHHCTHP